jgi:hypothetical protein
MVKYYLWQDLNKVINNPVKEIVNSYQLTGLYPFNLISINLINLLNEVQHFKN